ncbi:MAG: phosphodiester glycosidase family protein [Candidatus Poribacteria bacterium]|nr:phosphodiester glycosidase family protein [Candidatus Poribacteria bacterium]
MRFGHRLGIIISIICLFIPVAHAAGKKTQLFPDQLPGLNIYKYDWDVETCVLYVAEMSRKESTLHFEVALANSQVLGKETVRSIAKRRTQRGDRRVVVAVNGGFGVLGDMRGYGGVLESLHVQDGELITHPTDTDACFGVTETGEFLSSPVKMKSNLQIDNQSLEIGCINQRRLDGCKVILYTPRLGESTRTNRRRGKEIMLSGLKLPLTPNYTHPYQVKSVSSDGNSAIPRDGAILWISTQVKTPSVNKLIPGASGKLTVTLSPPEWNQVRYAVGGRLRLLRNGKINQILVDKHNQEKKHVPGKRNQELNLSHEPRTALGYNADKLFLVVADGRQPKYSTGLTLYELASILIELGATEAINLDGGSSSTFVVNDEVINKPSGNREREVLNAVFITKVTK